MSTNPFETLSRKPPRKNVAEHVVQNPPEAPNEPTKLTLEHIPGDVELMRHFQNTPYEALCRDALHCSSNALGPVLEEELKDLKEEHADPKNLDRIRELIRDASWRNFPPAHEDNFLELAQRALEKVLRGQEAWRRVSLMDEAEDQEETAQDLRKVIEVFERGLSGKEAAPAMEAAERLLEQAKNELKAGQVVSKTQDETHPHIKRLTEKVNVLQRIRNEIYKYALYPGWTAAGRDVI